MDFTGATRPALCHDCWADILPDGGQCQTYMVADQVWAAAGLHFGAGHLCVACLEIRLGRTLTFNDLTDCGLNVPDARDTPRLRRLKADRQTAAAWARANRREL